MARADFQGSGASETLVASAARTASGNSATLAGFGFSKTIRAQVDVTAATGTTPTLDVVIEDTIDGTNFYTIGTFAPEGDDRS